MKESMPHIRDFTARDRAAYIQMAKMFYCSDAVSHTVPEECFTRTFALCIKKSPYVRGLMLELEAAPAGFALLALTYSNEAGGLVVWIEELFLLPEHRGKGLGNALFGLVEESYQGKAVRYRLEVAKSNAAAIRMYHSLGYEEMSYLPMVKAASDKNSE